VRSAKAEAFSLTGGGLLHRLQRRAGLIHPPELFLKRRVVIAGAVTWLPLLLLSWSAGLLNPFFHDLTLHARLLLNVPLLVLAEVLIDQRVNQVVRHFVDSELVTVENLPAFESAIDKAERWRDSLFAELALFLLSYGLLLTLVLTRRLPIPEQGWYGVLNGTGIHPTRAAWWYLLVSVPLAQVLLFRWLWRLLIWWRFLAHVAKADLHLIPTHPDRAAGLGMLGWGQTFFAVVFQGPALVLSAHTAQKILFEGAPLTEFKVPVIGFVVLVLIAIFGPLLVFTGKLSRAKRDATFAYNALASDYTHLFDRKWIQSPPPAGESLLGTADIQSLADMGGSYERLVTMRLFPAAKGNVLGAVVITILPFLPLALMVMPFNELVKKLLAIML
jgi:hypothetical protein